MGSLRTLNSDKFFYEDFKPKPRDLSQYLKNRINLEIKDRGHSGDFYDFILVPLICNYGFSQDYRVTVRPQKTGHVTYVMLRNDGKS